MVFKLKKQKLLILLFFILILALIIPTSYCESFGDVAEAYQDSQVRSGDPDTNYGSLATMVSGWTVGNGYFHALADFNTSTVPTQDIPFVYLKIHGHFSNVYPYYYYVNFNVYRIVSEWDEDTVTWNTEPDYESVDTFNITTWSNIVSDYLYLNITDDFSEVYGESFVDFYGYMVYMQKIDNEGRYFEIHTTEYGSEYATIYYSSIALDQFGEAYSEEEGEEEEYMGNTNLTTTQFNDFMFLFLFLIVPSLSFAMAVREIAGIAFVGGLGLMAGIGYVAGIVALWFLLLIFIVIGIILFAMLKRGIVGF